MSSRCRNVRPGRPGNISMHIVRRQAQGALKGVHPYALHHAVDIVVELLMPRPSDNHIVQSVPLKEVWTVYLPLVEELVNDGFTELAQGRFDLWQAHSVACVLSCAELRGSNAHPAWIRLVSSRPLAAQPRLADEARTSSCLSVVGCRPLHASLQAPCAVLVRCSCSGSESDIELQAQPDELSRLPRQRGGQAAVMCDHVRSMRVI